MSHHEEKNQDRQNMADKARMKANEAAGKAQGQAGKATGNREQEIRGKAREASGQPHAKPETDRERNYDR